MMAVRFNYRDKNYIIAETRAIDAPFMSDPFYQVVMNYIDSNHIYHDSLKRTIDKFMKETGIELEDIEYDGAPDHPVDFDL